MKIQYTSHSYQDVPVHALIVFVEQDRILHPVLKELAQKHIPHLEQVINHAQFSGKAKSILPIPLVKHETVCSLLLVGLGKADKKGKISIEQYRRALGTTIKTMQRKKLDSAWLLLPDPALFAESYEYVARETASTAHIAAYHFDQYITDPERRVNVSIELQIHAPHAEQQAVSKGIEQGNIIGTTTNQVRRWIDLPAGDLPPLALAQKAQEIAQEHKLDITVFSEDEIKAMGMGGIAGVSAGSQHDAKLVIMRYSCADKNAPTVAFVGKGITFDSGGLSLKPASYMETMKEDMSGAAAVIGVMNIIARFKPAINILAVAPMAENMPSGTATRPGDILRFYNGKTAEVKNTDAEGRLILADALSYVVEHYKPDAIIDLATLTGACSYALGPFFSGLMSQHPELAQKVKKAAERSGDRVWELPLDNDFKAAIQSPVADMCNSGNAKYRAGAITAACFLQNFVGSTPWVHLDIAGTAFDVPDSYFGSGATGYGVRLLTDLALHWHDW